MTNQEEKTPYITVRLVNGRSSTWNSCRAFSPEDAVEDHLRWLDSNIEYTFAVRERDPEDSSRMPSWNIVFIKATKHPPQTIPARVSTTRVAL